jgi:hypothetical protein
MKLDVFCVYPAMSKKSENLSDLSKKDRIKRHSSPFINVVKGVFFVVCITLVPVSQCTYIVYVHTVSISINLAPLIYCSFNKDLHGPSQAVQ